MWAPVARPTVDVARTPTSEVELSTHMNQRLLVGGAVLTGIGGMTLALGLALGSAAVLGAGRRWQRSTEMTPTQLALHAVGAARAATFAGAGAWRDGMPNGQRPAHEPVS